jgi:NOL1/NOP2/fmu family ribosome biogenesis protein
MFRKDEEAQKQWSEDNVALCEARQKRIVADVWPALAQGGLFIYSTCTFNRLENDLNVGWISKELAADFLTEENIVCDCNGVIKTEYGYSLVPGFVEGEGQYCAALRKTSEVEYKDMPVRKQRPGKGTKETPMPKGLEKLLNREASFRMKGETVTAVPAPLSSSVAILEQSLHIVAAGCALGTVKGSLLIPDADLALSLMLNEGAFPSVEVDRMTALSYLHRDAIALPADTEKGYVLIRHDGLPLGFVKNLGNRCNSLHPQSRRIRMDINR